MLRGAVLHCQFEREVKGGPPHAARWWLQADAPKHCQTLGCISGMSREVLKVQFLHMKALLSLDHHGARSSLVQAGRTEQWYSSSRVPESSTSLVWSACWSSAVAEFDTAERIN